MTPGTLANKLREMAAEYSRFAEALLDCEQGSQLGKTSRGRDYAATAAILSESADHLEQFAAYKRHAQPRLARLREMLTGQQASAT